MAERHWSADAHIARTDVALALSQHGSKPIPQEAQYRLDFLNIVLAVDFQTMKSDQAIPRLLELLEKIRAEASRLTWQLSTLVCKKGMCEAEVRIALDLSVSPRRRGLPL
ncbi:MULTISPECIES: hypothetical protein [unclassified Rathayibacter]|uniref:hypothetical protein n=1 Tax=unclassified Rathayibacter TaxID=2609250 RepID=UPI00188BF01A|nr:MULTISPECIES: hypothetical protein [unclassified Rathayibacter]MBF4462747.1 hypothetical protein [Rathayibacter sp. VKM Ac-2879]MBF4504161.1 hypothetical protein [Rathayibacter sp. VKM Ac-2878]